MVRAHGSYPWCPGFKSLRRYQKNRQPENPAFCYCRRKSDLWAYINGDFESVGICDRNLLCLVKHIGGAIAEKTGRKSNARGKVGELRWQAHRPQ